MIRSPRLLSVRDGVRDGLVGPRVVGDHPAKVIGWTLGWIISAAHLACEEAVSIDRTIELCPSAVVITHVMVDLPTKRLSYHNVL